MRTLSSADHSLREYSATRMQEVPWVVSVDNGPPMKKMELHMGIRFGSKFANAHMFLVGVLGLFCGPSCSDKSENPHVHTTADASEDMDSIDSGIESDLSTPPQDAQGADSPSDERLLFVIAGQSNAEGNVFHNGLLRLAAAVPTGQALLSDEERKEARRAVGRSLGSFCGVEENCIDAPETCEESPPFTHATADVVIDALRASGLEWRDFDLNFRHPTVQVLAAQYHYSPVVVLDGNGQEVNNEECGADPTDTTTSGPTLDRYTQDSWAPLAPGFGALEDPEEGLLYGPELAFGAAIGQSWPNAFILKVAMGGSSLGDHWRVGGPLYETLLGQIENALAERNAELGGLIWFQGFNDQFDDAYCEPLTPDYEARLRAFFEGLRQSLREDVPVVIIKARNGGNLGEIQRAQENVSAGLSRVELVETADLSDCFHYDSGAQLIIGERAADAMKPLIDGAEVSP
jgi:hypothetical protein